MLEVPVEVPNKHELRTRETRGLLLAAAQTIFVRDGYEGAELGEIASLAGRTKGAIYAHFKSKEDIFLALIGDRIAGYRAQMQTRLAQSTTIEGNRAALRAFHLHLTEDQTWPLLLLEFKLFALRHPESRTRLRTLYAGFLSESAEARIAEILGPASTGQDAISRVIAVEALQPLISALVLEAQLGNSLSHQGVLQKLTNRLFDCLLDGPCPPTIPSPADQQRNG